MKINLSRRLNSVYMKLLRSVAIAIALAILVSGLTVVAIGNQNAKSDLVQGLEVITQIIADRSAASLVFRDPGAARQNLTTAANKEGVEQLCLYDANGKLFSTFSVKPENSACFAQDDKTTQETNVVFKANTIWMRVPVMDQGDYLGQLVLISNTDELNNRQNLYMITIVSTLFVALVIALLISRRLVNHTLAPLSELYKTARTVSKDPLSHERAKKLSQDEFGRVVDVFNSMLDAFQDESKALAMSESRFRSLSESSPVGVYQKNAAGNYLFTNPAWNDITGLTKQDADGFVERIDVRDREQYLRTLANATDFGGTQVIEFQFVAGNGDRKSLMEYMSAVQSDEKRPTIVGSLVDVTELKNAQVELEKLAFYDPLTKLPNRRFFRDHLEFSIARAATEGKKIAVYMVDLDDFKKVNDSLGHDIGDALLVKIAVQLRDAVHEQDVVSRMGGDEFMLLLDNIDDPTKLESASKRILAALQTKMDLNGHKVQVSGSIGASIFPTDAKTPEELVRFADIALYNAKAKRGGRISYYSQDLDRKIKEKLRLEQKLRYAIEHDALEVYFQPQYKSSTRKMHWGEALVRWRDPEDGFIPPDIFIPLAEETGLIHLVGDFVLTTVCRKLNENQSVFGKLGIEGVSVNLSARQFFADDLIKSIQGILSRFDIEPSMIEFELTESMVMDDVGKAIQVMESIRDLGCQLSIDDFGTGYSSLSYLKRFPITSLKIDRSFIKEIPEDKNDVEIALAIIAMAHNLGLTVVAEGVETEVQVDFLAGNECEYLQGYFFDRPMPFDELFQRASQVRSIKSASDSK